YLVGESSTHASVRPSAWLPLADFFTECAGARGDIHRNLPVTCSFIMARAGQSRAAFGAAGLGAKYRRSSFPGVIRESSRAEILPEPGRPVDFGPAGVDVVEHHLPLTVHGFCFAERQVQRIPRFYAGGSRLPDFRDAFVDRHDCLESTICGYIPSPSLNAPQEIRRKSRWRVLACCAIRCILHAH